MTQATQNNNLLSQLGSAIDSVTLNQVRHTLNNLSPPDVAHQLKQLHQNLEEFYGNWLIQKFLGKLFMNYRMKYN